VKLQFVQLLKDYSCLFDWLVGLLVGLFLCSHLEHRASVKLFVSLQFYNLRHSVGMIKSRRMGWAGHVARMGGRGMHIGYWWGSHKERDH
jgi:hypothetical protein